MPRIRAATDLDCETIREVHLSAFSEDERQIVSMLAINLLSEQTSPETFALVAEIDDAVVGHIAFSPVTVDHDPNWSGYILAPLGVKPEYQKHRVGSELIKSSIRQLSENGVNVLFVYGDPKYYGRFGFNTDTASGYTPPYKLQYPFGWQAIGLNEGELARSDASLSCVAPLRDPGLW